MKITKYVNIQFDLLELICDTNKKNPIIDNVELILSNVKSEYEDYVKKL